MDRKQRSKWRLESMRRLARCYSFLVLADRDVNEAPESLFFPAYPSLPFSASVKALSKSPASCTVHDGGRSQRDRWKRH